MCTTLLGSEVKLLVLSPTPPRTKLVEDVKEPTSLFERVGNALSPRCCGMAC